MSTNGYILVYSTSHAIHIEKLLLSAGAACRLIPVPRHLSSDCGVCVRFSAKDTELVSTLLALHSLEYEQLVIE